MDTHLQPNPQPSVPPEQVEITDCPGQPAVPPIATPPPQHGIKQLEPSSIPRPPTRWSINNNYNSPNVTNEGGKLVLTKNKWGSPANRMGWIGGIIALAVTAIVLASWSSLGAAMMCNGGFIVLVIVAMLPSVVWQLVKSSLDTQYRIVFDRSANTITDKDTQIASISDLAAINLDKQVLYGWRIALVLAWREIVELDKWYDQAEATYVAQAIADYIGVAIERTETP